MPLPAATGSPYVTNTEARIAKPQLIPNHCRYGMYKQFSLTHFSISGKVKKNIIRTDKESYVHITFFLPPSYISLKTHI